MTTFEITDILTSDTVRIQPGWEFPMKDGSVISGSRIKIRELDPSGTNRTDIDEIIKARLRKLLIGNEKEVSFVSPELIDTHDCSNAIVSCSVYIAKTNISYYFPEFVSVR